MSRTNRAAPRTAGAALVASALLALGAAPAGASTFGVPLADTTTNASGSGLLGQTFLVPAGDLVVRAASFGVASSPAGARLRLAPVAPGTNVVGDDVWVSEPFPATSQRVMLSGTPNVRVRPGGRYILYIDTAATVRATYEPWLGRDAYVDGSLAAVHDSSPRVAYDWTSGFDAAFSVTTEPDVQASTGAIAFPEQPAATFGPARTVEFVNRGDAPATVRRAAVAGTDRDDVLVTSDGCAGRTIPVDDGCAVTVRFVPADDASRPSRSAALSLVLADQGRFADEVALTGTVGSLPTGPAGGEGPKGETGNAGANGQDGAVGPAGDPGATGAAGAQGPAGATGADGVPGVDGAAGADGDPGATGATGATGAIGARGETGDQGAPGLPGPQGPVGLRGPRGLRGTTAVYRCVRSARTGARCFVDLSRGTGRRTVRVTITRGGRTVASGQRTLSRTGRQRVAVTARRAPTTGTYRVRVRIAQRGQAPVTLTSTFRGSALR